MQLFEISVKGEGGFRFKAVMSIGMVPSSSLSAADGVLLVFPLFLQCRRICLSQLTAERYFVSNVFHFLFFSFLFFLV